MAEVFSNDDLTGIFSAKFGQAVLVSKITNKVNLVEKGDNYCSSTQRFSVEYQLDGKHKAAHLFAKFPPTIESNQAYVSTYKIFERETMVYNSLLPEMCRIAEEHGVPKKLRPPYPEVYFAQGSENKLQTIVLEDLTLDGYKLGNRAEGVEWEEAELVIKAIARYR